MRNTCSFWKHLRVRISIFKDEVFEERVPNPITSSNLESELRLMVSNETPDFARLAGRMQDQGSH